MSSKREAFGWRTAITILCLALSISTAAYGQPALRLENDFVDGESQAVLYLLPDPNAIDPAGTELTIEVAVSLVGFTLGSATVNTDAWPTPVDGSNPFLGEPTSGLWTNDVDRVFASFEAAPFGEAEEIELLRLGLAPEPNPCPLEFGVIADGAVTQQGVTTTGLSADSILVGDLSADITGDCRVDLLDLDILGRHFGAGPGATMSEGDLNGDGFVDLIDLDILGSEFASNAPTAIPEPTGAALLLAGAGGAGFRSRFRCFRRPR